MRVGILGGTFDPVHYAHLALAEEARTQLDLKLVIFLPAGQPPHKLRRIITPTHHRLTMLQLALKSNPHFVISRVDVDRLGPCYTADTLVLLQRKWGPETEFYFTIGADSLLEMCTWYRPERIIELAHLAVAARSGHPFQLNRLEESMPGISQCVKEIRVPLLDISSTDLRRRLREGQSIKYYLPEDIEAYVVEHKLYQDQRET